MLLSLAGTPSPVSTAKWVPSRSEGGQGLGLLVLLLLLLEVLLAELLLGPGCGLCCG
jgi:uncharacterized membrane protein